MVFNVHGNHKAYSVQGEVGRGMEVGEEGVRFYIYIYIYMLQAIHEVKHFMKCLKMSGIS